MIICGFWDVIARICSLRGYWSSTKCFINEYLMVLKEGDFVSLQLGNERMSWTPRKQPVVACC